MKLTDRQKEVLRFIKGFKEAEGICPTRQEIANHFGFRSLTAAQDHLKALARKGAIRLLGSGKRLGSVSRGIALV